MHEDIRKLQEHLHIMTVFVMHGQFEAMGSPTSSP